MRATENSRIPGGYATGARWRQPLIVQNPTLMQQIWGFLRNTILT